jgi:hypothetical protein
VTTRSTKNIVCDRSDICAQLERRHQAAHRMPPIGGHHDPALKVPERPREPSTFGLSRLELIAEATRLRTLGWSAEEIAVTLTHPREMAIAA